MNDNTNPYQDDQLLAKARKVKLLVCDVDGVLTDGKINISKDGESFKSFCVKDGFGIKALQQEGIEVGIITGRESKIVERRCQELGIDHLFQGQKNKVPCYKELLKQLDITADEVAYIGDDVPDIPLIKLSTIGATVADAHESVFEYADFICQKAGGAGAVRELCDYILQARRHSHA